MAISLQNIYDRLRPFLLANIDGKILDLITNTDLIRIANQTANDLNSRAVVNLERFYKKTKSGIAEDDDLTNYLVQGDILNVYSFRYQDSGYEDQYYSYTGDRLILKNAPTSEVVIDVLYLRRCEEVANLSDEVDLPEVVIDDYEQLLRLRMIADYSAEQANYETALTYYAMKARQKIARPLATGEVRGTWLGQSGDGYFYQIEKNYIGMENFTAGVDGNYYYVGE